jgi:hypothetical protein
MSGAAHSVFISYASADRAAARALRDTLAAAGLEVWLDEEELAGGEAWDAKIRNQIRTCTYFMPVISATTEARREGYFRREWRLAVERTLDLADDVMFLVPVVIDDTRDAGARVPEKFFTVQWLRAPGGESTPALQALAQRLAQGEAEAVPPVVEEHPDDEPVAPKAKKKKKPAAEPPPFPKFPAFPEHGHRSRFIYDLVVWFGHLLLAFWGHLPKFVRIIAATVVVFNVISFAFNWTRSAPERTARRQKEEVAEEVKQMLEANRIKARDRDRKGVNKAGDNMESVLDAAAGFIQGGRPVTLITFSGDAGPGSSYASEVFGQVCAELQQEGGKQLWSLSPIPLKPDALDAQIVARGIRMKSRFVLTGHASAATKDLPAVFVIRLFATLSGEMVWKETYELEKQDADDVAELIVAEVKKRLEAPAAPPPPAPPGK